MTAARRRGILVLTFASAVILAACASSSNASVAPPAGARTLSPPVRVGPSSSATPEDPRPAPREAVNPDPNYDYGFVVQITPQGFHPQWLVSGCCKPVTWRNLTTATQSVVFDHSPDGSGPIPPGGTWVFVPRTIRSMTYHSGVSPRTTGVLEVGATFDS